MTFKAEHLSVVLRGIGFVTFFALFSCPIFGQTKMEWSASRRLTVNDFKGAAPDPDKHQTLVLTFATDMHIKPGEEGKIDSFNDRVSHAFVADQSWIDWHDESRLRYTITLFDLGEWHARELRKRLSLNRQQVVNGGAEALRRKVDEEFMTIRSQYDSESDYGNNPEGQFKWERRISERLAALEEYCKTCKP